MNTPKSPILVPPSDSTLRHRLELKLAEYQTRKQGKGKPWEYSHPEYAFITFADFRDAFYKVEVLTVVLAAQEPVKTHDLSLELFAKQGDKFDEHAFSNACAAIEMYLDPSRQMPLVIQRGTGLPKIPAESDPAVAG